MGTPETALARLEALLDSELDALTRAEFSRLDDIVEAKDGLTNALTAEPAPDPGALDRLRAKARRNASALLAARRGLLAAQRRIAELASAARPETYDSAGQRQNLLPTTARLERRA